MAIVIRSARGFTEDTKGPNRICLAERSQNPTFMNLGSSRMFCPRSERSGSGANVKPKWVENVQTK